MGRHTNKSYQKETLLWSIALPGFGQFLNKKYVKATVLIVLEFIINVKGRINYVIVLSFVGKTSEAVEQMDIQWIMFYPCVYMFAVWDAYKDAGGGQEPFSFMPFVGAAFLGTLGVIYSTVFKISGVYIGPVFLPIIFMISGSVIGAIIKKTLLK